MANRKLYLSIYLFTNLSHSLALISAEIRISKGRYFPFHTNNFCLKLRVNSCTVKDGSISRRKTMDFKSAGGDLPLTPSKKRNKYHRPYGMHIVNIYLFPS